MDFKQMEFFLSIYEEGSISKAAERLFISQQGLSKAILALEKELDCKLFERRPKGVILTKAGEALHLHASKCLELQKSILQDMSQFREHEQLNLDMVIGSRFSFPKGFFKKFYKSNPDLEFNMNERKNEICIYNVEHGKADLAIVIQPKRKEGYVYESMKQEPLTIVMSKEHPLAKKEEITIADLEGARFAYQGGHMSIVFLEQCKRQGVSFAKLWEMPGLPAIYQTCANGEVLGLSIKSVDDIFQFPNLISVPIRCSDVVWDITLMYHESSRKRKEVQAFLAFWEKER